MPRRSSGSSRRWPRRTGRFVAGPWLGEVGFELLYWIPFLRWFCERFGVPRDRLIAVSRGGSAAAWYGSIAGRSHDALSFMALDEFKRKNADRSGRLGEQKQIAATPLDDEIVSFVRQAEGRLISVLHPSIMYRLFAPYWWGHKPLEWVRQYTRYSLLAPPALPVELPLRYTAVKFYFNDCFRDTPENRAFVDEVVHQLADDGPVISLSTGVAVDDHDPCEPDIAAMQGIRHLLSPQSNLRGAVGSRRRRAAVRRNVWRVRVPGAALRRAGGELLHRARNAFRCGISISSATCSSRAGGPTC